MNGLDEKKLTPGHIYSINSDDIVEKSKPNADKLVLIWEEASTFEIVPEESFTWTMKSKLTGNTHRGSVECN